MTELVVFAAVVFVGTAVMCAIVIWVAARQADRHRDLQSRPDPMSAENLAALERIHRRREHDL